MPVGGLYCRGIAFRLPESLQPALWYAISTAGVSWFPATKFPAAVPEFSAARVPAELSAAHIPTIEPSF